MKKKRNIFHFSIINFQFQKGFTLIELLLYISLIAIFISGAILFAWDIIFGGIKSHVQQEVTQNLRLASKRIMYEIRNASGINSLDGSTISLAMSESGRNPTIFDICGGRLWIRYGTTGTCAESSACDPASVDCKLTSNEVTVSALAFRDLSTSGGESKNIQFTITIDSNNPSGRQEWEKSQTYTTTIELRSN